MNLILFVTLTFGTLELDMPEFCKWVFYPM